MNPPSMTLANLAKTEKKRLRILIILKNHLAAITACHDVVNSTRILVTQCSRHP